MENLVIHQVKHIRKQAVQFVEKLKNRIYEPIALLDVEGCVTREPVRFTDRMYGQFRRYRLDEVWGTLFDCAWFHITGVVPPLEQERRIALRIDFNGEGCLYDEAGCPVRGLTNVSSTYDYTLGMPGKRIVPFLDRAKGGEVIDLWADFGCNDLFGRFTGEGRIRSLDICTVDDEARDLYYDLVVILDLLDCIDPEKPHYSAILYALKECMDGVGRMDREKLVHARTITSAVLANRTSDRFLEFLAVGHGHIDLAWLWPIRETRRKAARTFSTQLALMEGHENYIFGASQAQLYQWVKEDHPLLYEKMKRAYQAGRWEIQGGTWVEADINLPSGESLVRQFLYGQRFFQKEFGRIQNILWLPDVFGFSASLPQIMKKAGCRFMMTTKLNWNSVNEFPFHTFQWVGLDGTSVLVHMPPEGNYGSAALPHSFDKAARNYREKGLCPKALCVFGISDGGGGPGPEHLERIDRCRDLAGLPPVQPTTADGFFREIEAGSAKYPVYKGELYLERHQGTFTTQAMVKRCNRRLEQLLHDTELLCTMAGLDSGFAYPGQEIESIWKEVLLYQFHDILPGSSIQRVYEETFVAYERLEQHATLLLRQAVETLRDSEGRAFFNQLPWLVEARFIDQNRLLSLRIPAFGCTTLEQAVEVPGEIRLEDDRIETDCLRIDFDANGSIVSLYDKSRGRELVPSGRMVNRLVLHVDEGDAWDFPIDYRDRTPEIPDLISTDTILRGTRAVRTNTYAHGETRIEQKVVVDCGSRLIDFHTEASWHESGRMLRAEFPLNVFSDSIDCEIQFGHIRRSTLENTSLEYAQQEICAHRWVDVSEADYGVALLNDCKYGHHAKNGLISLALLRSTDSPGVDADQGLHEFRYGLYLHDSALIDSDVIHRGYEYNYQPMALDGPIRSPFLAETEHEGILLEFVKMSEDGEDVILRLYESRGASIDCGIRLSPTFIACRLVNLLEEPIDDIPIEGNRIVLAFRPFEIHTLRLGRNKPPPVR